MPEYVLNTSPIPLCETELSEQFVSNLGKRLRGVEPEYAWIFGSSIELGSSAGDIDVAIVSSNFNGIRYPIRRSMVEWPNNRNIDAWQFTVEEFDNLPGGKASIKGSLAENRIDITNFIYNDI